MMLNEELQADWSKVKIEFASPNRNLREKKVYGNMYSNGSRSVKESQKLVQQVGASARARLIQAAATKWGVPASECSSASSVITHTPSGKTIRYGEVAADAAKIKLDKEPAIKPTEPVDLRRQADAASRCRAQDQRRGQVRHGHADPGHGLRSHPAMPGAGREAESVDASVVAGMPGNPQVVKLDNAVAVAAEGTWWRARQALAKLQPEWDVGAAGNTDSAQFFREYRAAMDSEKPVIGRKQGDIDKGLSASGGKTFEAVYETPYLSHSPMEPMNATVKLDGERIDIWVGTQDALDETEAAAKKFGIEAENVYFHNAYCGGGFGRRDVADEVIQAIAGRQGREASRSS